MSSDGWVGPWRPNRPRAPTAIQFHPPGPKYSLPSGIGYKHRDPSCSRSPAYSFGREVRLGGPDEPRSPGPQYMVPAGFTARGQYRAPAFTMGGRPRVRRAAITPGPAYYSPELAARVTLPSAPACSLSSRGRTAKPEQTPGPACYQLPPVMGAHLPVKRSAPECIITGRRPSIFEDNKKTPGPSHYGTVDTDVYMARAPRCTMTGRSRPPRTSVTPGPGDYSPKQGRKQGQTFGVRYAESVIPMRDPRLQGSGDLGDTANL